MRPSIKFLSPVFAMLAIVGSAGPVAASQVLTVTGVEYYRYDYTASTYDYSQNGTAFKATITYDDATPPYYAISYAAEYSLPSMSIAATYAGGTFEESAATAASGGFSFNSYASIYNDDNYTNNGMDSTLDSFNAYVGLSKTIGSAQQTTGASLYLSNTLNSPSGSGFPANNALSTLNLAGLVPDPSRFGYTEFSLYDTTYDSSTGKTTGYSLQFQVNSITGAVVAPEPSTLAGAGVGLALLIGVAVRRHRKVA